MFSSVYISGPLNSNKAKIMVDDVKEICKNGDNQIFIYENKKGPLQQFLIYYGINFFDNFDDFYEAIIKSIKSKNKIYVYISELTDCYYTYEQIEYLFTLSKKNCLRLMVSSKDSLLDGYKLFNRFQCNIKINWR